MVEMEVLLKELSGTHITPLTQNIIFDQPTEVTIHQSIKQTNKQTEPSAPSTNSTNPDLTLATHQQVPFPDLLAPLRGPVRDNFLLTVNQVRDEILAFLESTFG